MNLARHAASTAGLLFLAGCASMSDRYHVAGQDGGGDYYYAPQPQGDRYYDPYFSSFDFYYGFGFGSPFNCCAQVFLFQSESVNTPYPDP